MRLDKFLADCGIGSRKEIKQLLKSGTVICDGKTVTDASLHIDENTCSVSVGDTPVVYRKYVYLMLNKPKGYISATFDKKLPTVCDLVDEKYSHFDIAPAGRLDIDTEGFLILTNDGKFTHRILSPKSHVDKTYFAIVEKPLKDSDVSAFKEGVVLDDGYKTMPADLLIGKVPTECTLVIREGKFHQVKRMMEAVGNKVLYLKRVKIGSLLLDESLPLGKFREMTEEEIKLAERKSQD